MKLCAEACSTLYCCYEDAEQLFLFERFSGEDFRGILQPNFFSDKIVLVISVMLVQAVNKKRCNLYALLVALGVHSFDASDMFS